ncbi:MAG: tRNA (adenosine(37)-N6)-threonylcarbamoyltransferase complex dimerization subunit type 1 TsaB [Candidatus Omnitrophota bacterium]
MKILAFDTSTEFLSLACLDNGDVAAEIHERAGIKHSEILVPRIKDILEKAGWSIHDIELLAIGVGPGSFTGLRIGVSTVKGLSLVIRPRIVAVSSLDAIAMRAPEGKELIVPVLDAHKGKVYACVYERSRVGGPEKRTEYMLCNVESIKDKITEEAVVFGSAIDKYRSELQKWPMARIMDNVDWFPRAVDIGRTALRLSSEAEIPAGDLEPMYLYSKECNILKK